MLTIIRAFLLTLGVIFLLLLLGLAYIWFSNTWQVQTLVKLWQSSATPVAQSVVSNSATTTPDASSSNDALERERTSSSASSAQTEAMTEAGVDESFFTSLSDTEVQCFRDRLGGARVDEIVGGAVPTTAEIVTGLPCVE